MSNMATSRIRRSTRGHLYIDEWFEDRGLNDEKVANRLGVTRQTIWKWRKEQHRLDPIKIAQLAEALDLEPEELWRPPAPDRPSLDAMMKDKDDDAVRKAAILLMQRFHKTG